MGANVLVIDDDAGMCESLKDLLSLEKVECASAETGKKGLAMVRSELPQLVVVDLQLPDMSGFQVCQMIKKEPALRHIPVVLMTGRFTEPVDRVQGFDLGADEFFAKPFDPVYFVARLKSLLRQSAEEVPAY